MDRFCRCLLLATCLLFCLYANAVETLNELEMGRVIAAGGGLESRGLANPEQTEGDFLRIDEPPEAMLSTLDRILQRRHHRGGETEQTVISSISLTPALPSAASTQPIRRVTFSPAGNDGMTSWTILPGEQQQASFIISDPRFSNNGVHVFNNTRVHDIRQENVQFPGQPILDRAGSRTMHGLEVSSETMMFGR